MVFHNLQFKQLLNNWVSNIAKCNIVKCIYPPVCIICSNHTENYNQICEDCIASFAFPGDFLCSNCGNNLDINNYNPKFGDTCVLCVNKPPYFSQFAATLLYNDIAAQLISSFKYKDKQELSKLFAMMLAYGCIGASFTKVDIIIPMPISYLKLIARKYNQVLLMALYLSKDIGIPCKSNILYKCRHTKPQASLDLKRRLLNVKDSFAVKNSGLPLIQNKTVLLIDDIVTTGTTINEAAKTLKIAGAKRIYILAVARVKGEFKIY